MQRDRRYKNETIVILKERAAKRAQKQEQPK